MTRTSNQLHIPEPPSRPGGNPEFDRFAFAFDETLVRPDPLAAPGQALPLANGLIRVLDDEGMARGAWAPRLEPEFLLHGLRCMLHTRLFDDYMLMMQRQGKVSFYAQSTGEEAVSIGASLALDPEVMMFPTYRQVGLLFARGVDPADLICQVLSNTGDRLHGQQLPTLYSFRELGFFSISGNLATQFPQAVGWAMANVYKGLDHLTMGWIGDGSAAEGDFHYALNFASTYHVPVLLGIANNQWAISTHQDFSTGGNSTLASRAAGYGLPGLRVDGNDFLAVAAATSWAAQRARRGGGATLIEYVTYRRGAHSTSDDPSRYRAAGEADAWPLGDPVDRLKRHLVGIGAWSEERHLELETGLKADVREAWTRAQALGTEEDGPWPGREAMFDHVFSELLPHLRRQRDGLEP